MLRHRLELLARYAARRTTGPRLPLEVYLEPTNACNLSCASCPRSRMTRAAGCMDFALFERIADQLAGGCEFVCLAVYGEPLLHPQLDRMVARLRERGIATAVTTNGTRLDRTASEALVDAGLDHLVVSVDTADPALYAQLRRGGDHAQVVENIRTFAEVARRRGRHVPVVLSAVSTDRLLESLPEFLRFARALPVAGTRFEPFIDVTKDPLVGGRAPPTAAEKHTHFYLWRKLYVFWDGIATTCPQHLFRLEPGSAVGDLSREAVAEVWNGARAREQRRRALARLPVHDGCASCHYAAYPAPAIGLKTLLHERDLVTRALPPISTQLTRLMARGRGRARDGDR